MLFWIAGPNLMISLNIRKFSSVNWLTNAQSAQMPSGFSPNRQEEFFWKQKHFVWILFVRFNEQQNRDFRAFDASSEVSSDVKAKKL